MKDWFPTVSLAYDHLMVTSGPLNDLVVAAPQPHLAPFAAPVSTIPATISSSQSARAPQRSNHTQEIVTSGGLEYDSLKSQSLKSGGSARGSSKSGGPKSANSKSRGNSVLESAKSQSSKSGGNSAPTIKKEESNDLKVPLIKQELLHNKSMTSSSTSQYSSTTWFDNKIKIIKTAMDDLQLTLQQSHLSAEEKIKLKVDLLDCIRTLTNLENAIA